MTGCPHAPPEVTAGRLMGSALAIRRDPLAAYADAAQHGDVVTLRIGPVVTRPSPHLVSHPDGVQHVLAAGGAVYAKGDPTFVEMRRWFGDGVLMMDGEPWRVRRRMLQPLFTARQVAAFDHLMAAETDQLVDRWMAAARSGIPVDVNEDMAAFTMLLLSRVLMGGDADAALRPITSAYPVLNRHVLRRLTSPVPFGAHLPSPSNIRAKSARAKVTAAARAVVDRRIEQGKPTGREDLVDRLLAAEDPETGVSMSRTDIVNELVTFLLAGQETTATALVTTLYLLAQHPEVQDEVRAQVDDVLSGRACEASDIDDLTAIGRALHESMRLYPPVWGITRQCTEDSEVGGHTIARGRTVAVSQWVTHRDPRWWPSPTSFDPDRWDDPEVAERHRYGWFPFGGGPRACIGRRFALQEATIALAGILQRFRLQPVTTELHVQAGVTLTPSEPVYIQLAARAS